MIADTVRIDGNFKSTISLEVDQVYFCKSDSKFDKDIKELRIISIYPKASLVEVRDQNCQLITFTLSTQDFLHRIIDLKGKWVKEKYFFGLFSREVLVNGNA